MQSTSLNPVLPITDTQLIELLGRNRLIDDLLRAGLEVALPARDRGIDLIAYADLRTNVDGFVARPIQMKAASSRSFSVDGKYGKFANLIIAYVWHLDRSADAVVYALTFHEAVGVAEAMGWTNTASWKTGQLYTTTRPSKRLSKLLGPHRMDANAWWVKVTGCARQRRPPPPS